MKTKKKRILSLLLILVMVCTCNLVPNKLTVSAAEKKLVEESEPTKEEVILFEGESTSSDWGQALALQLGLDFLFDDFTDGLVIAVDYQGEKAPELILQGQASGVEWVKVNPTKTYEYETSNIAYFSLTDMVDAYRNGLKDYDTYDTIFPTLTTIYIGDTGTDLTVSKVYKTDADGMKLPSVTLTTENNYNTISQTYTITAERGDIDLSKLKIVYSATELSTKDHNVWCYYAGLTKDTPDWYYELTDSVNCDINDGKLNITIDKSIMCPETQGEVTLNIQFAKTDWSYYETLSDPVLEIYYNGVLVK